VRLLPGASPSVVCSGPDGTIQHIYFDGSVRKFTTRKFSDDHTFDIFDVNGDGFGEYIFIDNGMYIFMIITDLKFSPENSVQMNWEDRLTLLLAQLTEK